MRVLVLSWDVADPEGGSSPTARALARVLAEAGDRVRLVTRHPEGGSPGSIKGVEVHAVPDAAPIIPLAVGGQLSRVLAFSTRATTAAVRMLEQEPADVCFVEGWQPTYTATAVRSTHEVPIVAGIDASWFARGGPRIETRGDRGDDTLLHQIEWWLSYEARRVVSPTPDGADDLARVLQIPGDKLDVLPIPMRVSNTRPEPPNPTAPILVAPPTDVNARSFLLAVRRHMEQPHPLTTVWRRRPSAAVILDSNARYLAVRAAGSGVPLAVLGQPGLAGLVEQGRTGDLVTSPDPESVAAAIDRLHQAPERSRALALEAVASTVRGNAPELVVSRFRSIATTAIEEELNMQAPGPTARLRPVPPPAPSA